MTTEQQFRNGADEALQASPVIVGANGAVHRTEIGRPGAYVQCWVFVPEEDAARQDSHTPAHMLQLFRPRLFLEAIKPFLPWTADERDSGAFVEGEVQFGDVDLSTMLLSAKLGSAAFCATVLCFYGFSALMFQQTAMLALYVLYGVHWLVKHVVYPDESWFTKVTLRGFAGIILAVVLPLFFGIPLAGLYLSVWQLPLWLSLPLVVLAVRGLLIAHAADYAKFLARWGLGKKTIDTGLWATSRHPNYFGEMLFQACIALLTGSPAAWLITAWAWWAVMLPNLVRLDERNRRFRSLYVERVPLVSWRTLFTSKS